MTDSAPSRKKAPPGDRPPDLGSPDLGSPGLGTSALDAPVLGAPVLDAPALGATALGAPEADDASDPSLRWRPEVPGYDVYSRLCPTRLVLDRIADKWSMLVLGRLRRGPRRFNALRREVDGVSQKVLSQTLKALERDGLVRRTAFPTVPVTVEYAATPLGLTLGEVVAAVGRWAEANIEEVVAAQRQFDASRGDTGPGPEGAPQASRATT